MAVAIGVRMHVSPLKDARFGIVAVEALVHAVAVCVGFATATDADDRKREDRKREERNQANGAAAAQPWHVTAPPTITCT